MAHRLTTCTFCGVGCGLYLETNGNRIVGVYPSSSHPTNSGRICVRGWHVNEVAGSPDRLRTPLLRRNGSFEEVGWPEALDFVAGRLMDVRNRYGPDALAFLCSPRCSNEEAYLLQKMARSVIGTNNVDHGTGVYCNNSINVLLEMLGFPATTNSISELPQSDVIVVDGVDIARRMPTVAGTLIRAKYAGAKLIVIGTRRHRVADNADLFLQIRPGTEVLLYGALAKIIDDRGLANTSFIHSRCRGYEAFLSEVRQYDLLGVSEACGVKPELIEEAALTYGRARTASLLYSSSMEDRSADSIRALVNLVLLTGNLGKPGAGVFALTEQNNLQGVCDMGMLPNRLPGYKEVGDCKARDALNSLWHASVPEKVGLDARSGLDGSAGASLRGAWLCRYDPIGSGAFSDLGTRLRELELVIVQHLFMTDTAKYADVVLPTTAFGEEEVSFTSTDRRIQLAGKVIDADADLQPAWRQIADVAKRLGAKWEYQCAADVMEEIGRAVPFYEAANYQNLSRDYGRQWPCTHDRPLGTRDVFSNGNGSGRFNFAPIPKPSVQPVVDGFPLTIVFGNSLYYWNHNVLIRSSEALKREYCILWLDYPNGFVEINPDDAKSGGIRDGDRVRLSTVGGSAVAVARVTPEVMKGSVFVPHFMRDIEKQLAGRDHGAGRLLPGRIDKESA